MPCDYQQYTALLMFNFMTHGFFPNPDQFGPVILTGRPLMNMSSCSSKAFGGSPTCTFWPILWGYSEGRLPRR